MEGAYRPPGNDEVSAETTRLSKDEWRYAGRVFVCWVVGGALVVAAILTVQTNLSLSAFGGQEYLARVVTIEVLDRYGAALVMGAACNTLAMVVEARAKRIFLQPIRRVPLVIVGFLALMTPLAMLLILAMSLAIVTFVVGIPLQASWAGIEAGTHGRDIAISIFTVVIGALVLVALVSPWTHLFLRYRGWLILKFLVMSQVMGLLLAVTRAVANFVLAL